MDDITFCLSDCQRTDCFRHPSNIQDRTIPHSYAEFKGTETCPFAKDINVTINDDTISRKTVIDALWKAMYEYEDKMEKQFIESDDLDIEDWIQHRIFVQNMSDIDRQTILELPSVQPERMTNRQWVDFLSAQFDISRTSAKEMLHGMMRWKKEDNFKKMFNGGKT